MNESAWSFEDCVVCGRPCTECDNDGNPIHDECKVNRDAMQADSLRDGRDNG